MTPEHTEGGLGAFSQSQHRLAWLTSSTLDTLHQHSQLQFSGVEETDFVHTYGIWRACELGCVAEVSSIYHYL